MIAVLTASIVFGQLRAARSQASIAVIPALQLRLENISEANEHLLEVMKHVHSLGRALEHLDGYVTHDVIASGINTIIDEVLTHDYNIFVFKERLEKFGSDLKIDDDIRLLVKSANEVAYLNNIHSYFSFKISVDAVKKAFVADKLEALKSMAKSRSSQIIDAYRNVNLRHTELMDQAIQLEQLAAETSRLKTAIIASR